MNPSTRTPPVSPLLVLLLGILSTSTASIFIRYAQASAPSLLIAMYRLALATLVLAPLAVWKYRAELKALGLRQLALGLLSGIFLAAHFAAWITSLQYTSVASSVVLVSTAPLWIALLSPFTIKEPISLPVWAGMGMTLVGSVLIGVSDSCSWNGIRLACSPGADLIRDSAFLGDLLALAGAWFGAAYLLIGRRLRSSMSLISYIFVVYGIAAAILLVAVLGARQRLSGYPAVTYVWLVLLALVPQLLGHSSFNWALRYLTAVYVSITQLGEPIGSALLAYFLLGETPTVLMIIGAILILVGIYTASQSENRQNKQNAAAEASIQENL